MTLTHSNPTTFIWEKKNYQSNQGNQTNQTNEAPTPTLPTKAHILCGWPLMLIAIGGLVGGALGGGAYAVNLHIYKSNLSIPIKIFLNIITGVVAFVLWLAIAVAIRYQTGK